MASIWDNLFGAAPPPSPKQDRRKSLTRKARVVPENVPDVEVRTREEIMSTLSPHFYEEKFDPFKAVMESLPDDADREWLDLEIAEKEIALDATNTKLMTTVMDSHEAFVQGMANIHELGSDLKDTAGLCRNGRANLKTTKDQLTSSSLRILTGNRKAQIYRKMIEYLEAMKAIRETHQVIKTTLDEGDYPAAIQMFSTCRKSIGMYQRFACVRALNESLQSSYSVVPHRLDMSLLEVCSSFSAVTYERALVAYRLLGKSDRVMNKLRRHFKESINTTTQNIVYAHALMTENDSADPETLKKMKFRDLCAALHEQHFMSCLLHILEELTNLMHCHYRMVQWHIAYERQARVDAGGDAGDDGDGGKAGFAGVRVGLEQYRKNVWDEMQRNVTVILSFSKLASFKIDEFLKVFDAVNQFIEIGEEFSQCTAYVLRGSIKQQSKAYFSLFHAQRLDDLHTMFENEMWAKCPVHQGFGVLDIKEFKTFTHMMQSYSSTSSSTSKSSSSSSFSTPPSSSSSGPSSSTSSQSVTSFFRDFDTRGNPFSKGGHRSKLDDVDEEETRNGGGGSSSGGSGAGGGGGKGGGGDDDDDVALRQEYIDEGEPDPKDANSQAVQVTDDGPVLTSTSINVLRYIGKYLHMMVILQPIAFEVFLGITQIFEYYMFTVYRFFGTSMNTLGAHASSDKQPNQNGPPIKNARLHTALHHIRQHLGLNDMAKSREFKIRAARISTMVDIVSGRALYGFAERSTAAEAMLFLLEAMKSVKDKILHLLPMGHHDFFKNFYLQSVEMVPHLTNHIYQNLGGAFLNFDKLPDEMAMVRWDTKEIGCDHSEYVNDVVARFRHFAKQTQHARTKMFVGEKSTRVLWQYNMETVMTQLVEGFSRAKRCTQEGRVLMGLDFGNLKAALEKLTDIRPIPHVQYVDRYIKAYYLADYEFLPWIKEHEEYTAEQLLGLVICASSQFKKMVKEELLRTAEEMVLKRKAAESTLAPRGQA
eukprot:TRINITY_DN2060_c1_g1_i1.p1 TRINITY_DN2060_c1_g1~~TRINITY_DN2060_c1_g1_i1.p1  ORF type:complete len:988 (-),score=289.61 TRINITY_DN2060_c1_g1_i1:155-3118(-)